MGTDIFTFCFNNRFAPFVALTHGA
jgi:hypothetical protein